MKLTKFAGLLLIGAVLSFAATGCKKSPTPLTKIPPGSQFGANGDTNGMTITDTNGGSGIGQPTAFGNPEEWANATRDEKMFEANTVHFDYDSSVVKSSEMSKVQNVAEYLKGHPGTGVEIQGHCDERGTDEYNRALGERRALAIRDVVIQGGVEGNRVLTVTFGRSRPVDTGHSEASHAKNRRGVFVLLTKPST